VSTAEQLIEIRQLVESNGYLPYSNKALRLFVLAEGKRGIDQGEVEKLKLLFQDAGYLPFSRALELLELVARPE